MTRYVMVIDQRRCIGCHSCTVACRTWNKLPLDIVYNPVVTEGAQGTWPNVHKSWQPLLCMHCENPECVKVCPTEASHIAEDGTVQEDKEKCIGCQFCAMSCPYGVRYLNEEEKVVEKCTLCEQKLNQGELPQCVSQCGGNARWVGDMEQGLDSFVGSFDSAGEQRKMVEFNEPFSDSDMHKLPDVGNKPSFSYILRDHHWEGGDE